MLLNRAVFIFVIYFSLNYREGYTQTDAQRDTEHKKIDLILKGDILLPAFKIYSFTTEKLFCKRHSVQLTYLFSNSHTDDTTYPDVFKARVVDNTHIYMLIPEYKFFVSKKRNYTGYYVGAFVSYVNVADAWTNYTYIPNGYTGAFTSGTINGPATLSSSYKGVSQSLGIGFINGVQYYLLKHICMDFTAGLGIGQAIKSTGAVTKDNSSQLLWRLALNIGYKF